MAKKKWRKPELVKIVAEKNLSEGVLAACKFAMTKGPENTGCKGGEYDPQHCYSHTPS